MQNESKGVELDRIAFVTDIFASRMLGGLLAGKAALHLPTERFRPRGARFRGRRSRSPLGCVPLVGLLDFAPTGQRITALLHTAGAARAHRRSSSRSAVMFRPP
jgi:hypothetical protein